MRYKDDMKLLTNWLRVHETVRNHAASNTNANRTRNERRRAIIQWSRHWRRRNLAAYRRYQRDAAAAMCMAA